MRPFRDLVVWQESHDLTLRIYRATGAFPREELYGLTSQMRRAASSVPSNIVEGSARTDGEFRHALQISLGSATELEYQLLLAKDLGYLPAQEYTELDGKLTSIKKMLVVFMRRVAQPQQPTANSQRPSGRRGVAE